VIDHTVSVDAVNLWENGRLMTDGFATTRACLEQWPELTNMFTEPSEAIGLND